MVGDAGTVLPVGYLHVFWLLAVRSTEFVLQVNHWYYRDGTVPGTW